MWLVALLAVGAAAGAACFFLISGFLGEGAGIALTVPAVLFIALGLGAGFR